MLSCVLQGTWAGGRCPSCGHSPSVTWWITEKIYSLEFPVIAVGFCCVDWRLKRIWMAVWGNIFQIRCSSWCSELYAQYNHNRTMKNPITLQGQCPSDQACCSHENWLSLLGEGIPEETGMWTSDFFASFSFLNHPSLFLDVNVCAL